MARQRDSKGRFLKRRKVATNPRRRRHSRKRAIVANPRRTRRYTRHNVYFNPRKRHTRRRSYRHNPAIFSGGGILGMSFKEIGFAGVGFIAPPAIEGLIKGYLPSALTTNQFGRYAVKGGIVAGISLLGNKFLGREAGKYLAIGGATYLVANIIVDFVPTLFKGFSGYMSPGQTFQMPAMRRSPLLGKYVSGMGTAVTTADVPERLNPSSRF